ncbi:hypothetical protein DPMN_124843 [Dreissena polymorpha]|uniref:Uncharacterized protein n=1 Tax=Dreissena polymorpha TaxID=45954 RepID=A0A9D4GUA3_DREPO|nr:hypothetical protein DPMN_124843 [Dreissena polymorpha]
MASLEATSRRPKNGFPSTSRILSNAVLVHFYYLHRATLSTSWPVSLPEVRPVRPLCCQLRCFRPSSGDVVKPLSTYGQLPFRLPILPSSVDHRNQRERTSGSWDDGSRLINRAARTRSHIRHSSDDVVKQLSTY